MGQLMVDGPYGVQNFVVANSIDDLGLDDESKQKYMRVDLGRLGRPIPKVRPTLNRFFKSSLDVTEPTVGGSMFLRTNSDLSWVNKQLIGLMNTMTKGDYETGLIEAELDNAKKSILLTSSPPSKHIEIDGLVNDSDRFPEAIKILKDFFPVSVKDRINSVIPMTTSRGTNHGWPTYMPGADGRNSVDLLVHLKLATILMDDFKGDLVGFEDYMRKQTGVSEPLSASMFFRRQPYAKWTSEFYLTDSGPKFRGATKGKFCRQRQVFGVPLFINSAQRNLANYIRMAYKRTPNFSHSTPTDTLNFLLKFEKFSWFSEDLSGYDKSVSIGCQKALSQYFYGLVATPEETRLYLSLSYLPVLAPPLTSNDSAFLYRREGQTISGSIWTDKDGTLINFARIVDCMSAATGWSLGKVRREFNKSWSALVFGDDCSIGVADHVEFDREKYNQKSVDLGFKTEAFEGVIFLMNYFDLKKKIWFGVASRGLDRSFHKEYAVDDVVVDLFGTYNRLVRLENHPMGSQVIDSICHRSPANKAGIYSMADLKLLANSPNTLSYLVAYGEKMGKAAKMRDMMAGLTHGSLELGDISNSEFSPAQLNAIETILAGLTVSDDGIGAEVKLPTDIFKYIKELSSLEIKNK